MNFSSFSLKVLTASLVLASTTGLAFAKGANYKGEAVYKDQAPCPAPVMLKDGFYIGAEAGYDSYRVRANHSLSVTDPVDSDVLTASSNPAISATGWVGGLFLGYGRYLTDMFYLGGELLGTYSGAESSFNNFASVLQPSGENDYFNTNRKFEVNGMWGLALLPGIRLNDTSLGYVRLGYSWVNVKGKISATVTDVAAETSVVTNTFFSRSKTNTSSGFNFGLGIETLLWDNWSVRTEYTHYYYNSISANVSTSAGTISSKFDPSDNQFMLGINYHFA
jgi:opacity protein-like surface antigen